MGTTIQTIASIIQAVAAVVFMVTVILQRRDALIERLITRYNSTQSVSPDELLGTPYSKEQIEAVNKMLKAHGGLLSWRWNGR